MQVRKIDKSEWWDFIKDCSSATFFHTPDWYQVWQDHFGWKIETRCIKFKSGKKALLPLCSRKRLKGLIKEYFSGPVGTYGGVVINDSLLSKKEITLLENYLREFNSLELRANPFASILGDTFFTQKDFTQIIQLSKGWDTIFKQWTKGHSSAAKKGIREGVQVRIANKDEWKKYYDIYQKSRARWGEKATNNYGWELFKILSQLNPNTCKLWLALKDKKIISGCLCFYYNKHVVYWHGASLADYFHLRPVHVLQHYIIQHAMKAGYNWYDFNPSGGHEGVVKFKAGFGVDRIYSNGYNSKGTFLKIMTK